MIRLAAATAALVFWSASALAQSFDHAHGAWTALLKKHVVLVDGGKASTVRYAEFGKDRAALKAYLDSLSAVGEAQFRGWTKAQQMAFLINAYNAFTVELILQNPGVKSIKDIGGLFDNRWKRRFFTLLGAESYLDRIEHEILRKPGAYNEPRVHFAVNCASIGCPMLREEAFVAERLDGQLEEQAKRFLSDRTRNRFAGGKLEVSMIFNWFKEDWQSGFQGFEGKAAPIASREEYFARYASLLADQPADQKKIAERAAPLSFLEYDWSLNAAR